MKPLYTQVEFDNAKSRDRLPLVCTYCNHLFHKQKNKIQAAIKNNDNRCNFCSHLCCTRYRHKDGNHPVSGICDQCKKPLTKQHCDFKKSKHHFCSQSCGAKYTNAHKTHGYSVSKLERWIAEQLPLLYPGLEFHFNRRDAIKAELDIFIPSLSLAFELNGIFHYEPIYGPEQLGKIQNNDERRMQACIESSIELCILDVSTMSYFKPTKGQRFLDIIVSIINSKLSRISRLSPLPSQNHVEVP